MAYIECKLKSQRLLTTVGVKIYLPCDLPVEVGNKVKGVFTLLHGFTNSGDDWMQMTAAPATPPTTVWCWWRRTAATPSTRT